MPREIERRFLIEGFSPDISFPLNLTRRYIRQGYFELPDSGSSFRIRIIDNNEAVLTIKGGRGIDREELEAKNIELDFAKRAFGLCSHRLEKVRHLYGRWEIDFLKSPLDGIILAEIELKSRDESFEMPKWIGRATEVTDSLTNHHLARLATELRGSGNPALPYIFSHIYSQIAKIVITGGPCSGKSTIIEEIRRTMDDVHCMPEVATIVIGHLDIKPRRHFGRGFQRFVNDTQKLFEGTSAQYALLEGKRGILFDRGTVDGAAYMKGGVVEFEKTLRTKIGYEYSKYDLVICLDVPPEDVFEANRTNNPARSEDYPAARSLGDKIREVWQHHPNFVLIGNEGGWSEKVRKTREAITKVLK